MAHPRDEREWRREVERRLNAHGGSLSSMTGRILPLVTQEVEGAIGKQPTAPVELTYQTSLYLNTRGEWRGRFVMDFPDVTKATDGSDITVVGYELQGRMAETVWPPETDSPASSIVPPRASAKMHAPRIRVNNGGRIAPPPATASARSRNPAIVAGDDGVPFGTITTSTVSSLRQDDLPPNSRWTFRARAIGQNSATPGEWSDEVTVTIIRDTLPPQQLTKPIATVTRGTITVVWDGQTVVGQLPGDFAYAELAQGTAANPTEIVARFYDEGGFTVISDVPYYDPQFFRIRAVDESGNRGAWSAQEVAYVEPLVDEDVILSEIDAAKTLLINVDASVSILSDTILTRHLVITEDMTVALLQAHKIAAGEIQANAIEADNIKAGAVTAEKLEAELVLVSALIAGPQLGGHARMDGTGFRVFAVDNADGVPNEIGRMGVDGSGDFIGITRPDGSSAAGISQDGVGSFSQLNANGYDMTTGTGGIWLGGREIEWVIDRAGKGIINSVQRTSDTANNPVSGGPYVPYLRMEVTLEANRVYEIYTSSIRVDTDAATTGTVAIGFNFGAIPADVDNSSILTRGHATPAGATGGKGTVTLSELFSFPGEWGETRDYTFLIMLGVTAGAGAAAIRADQTNPARLTVEDKGIPFTNGVGEWLDGAGGTPPPAPPSVQGYVREWGCINSGNYTGSNATYPFDPGRMYQGLSPAGYGNLKSIGVFGDMTAELAGATIEFVRVLFDFQHWYYNGGGTARIGVHGHTGVPGSFSSVGPLSAISTNWPKPGARWVELSSSHWDGFRTGAYRGVYLEGDGSYGTYGYSNRPIIQIGFRK